MTRYSLFLIGMLVAGAPAVTAAQPQPPLTLDEAIARMRANHPALQGASAAVDEAAARVQQARSGWYPRVNVREAWQRGNHPVYAFSSLLSQRRFTAADFAIERLNEPDAISNHQFAVQSEAFLFDGGATRAAVKQASAGQRIAEARRRLAERDLAMATVDAYADIIRRDAALAAATRALEAAAADRDRAQARLEAGVVTEADVLAVKVRHAQLAAQAEMLGAERRIATERLNALIGAPAGTTFVLAPLAEASVPTESPDAAVTTALAAREEVVLADEERAVARAGLDGAKAAWMPTVGAQAGVEWNGNSFGDRAHSWFLGAEVRINVFNGFADKARSAAARANVRGADARREAVVRDVRLDVLNAHARLTSAVAQVAIGRDAASQAGAAHQIVRDRYEHGLVDVTTLLDSARAVADADARAVAATAAAQMAAVAYERALGRFPR